MSDQLLETPIKHPFSISGLADRTWNHVRESLFQSAWTPVARLAESAVVALMQNITNGNLRVLTYSHIYNFPAADSNAENPTPDLKAELRVVNDVFWIRLCTMSDLGFAEAYMYGDVECDDLVSTFLMFVYNRKNLSSLNSSVSYLFTLPQKLTSTRFLNTIGNSRSNISAHYDISNKMFAGFLSEDMTYSCAIFKDLDGDLKRYGTSRSEWSGGENLLRVAPNPSSTHLTQPDPEQEPDSRIDELQEAQLRKIDHIISRARIQPGHRVLEIGSGWGALALRIASTIPNTTIDTLTLSVHQQTLARERIRAAGIGADGIPYSERIAVHLMDYRAMPEEWEGAFDRFISVEMIEAVGREYLEKYWEVVDWAVKKVGGVGVVQVITIPEPIFPGGFLPTVTLLLTSLQSGSQGRFIVDSISNIGPHYARTLREWRRRFLARFDSVIVPALQEEYPEVMTGERGAKEIEVFKRKWVYYYCYCEVGFTTRTLGDHIITFTREGNESFGCSIFE